MCPFLEEISQGYDKEQLIAVLSALDAFMIVFVDVGIVDNEKKRLRKAEEKKVKALTYPMV